MTSAFLSTKKELPSLGVGLGLRRELATDTFENAGSIDWLEICPENYMDLGGLARERLEQAKTAFPLVSHGLNLSVGGTDDLSLSYMDSLKVLFDISEVPWWSDHLCFTTSGGRYLHDLLPIPLTKEAVKHVVERVKRAQDYIGRPFLLENISYYMDVPGSDIPESEFLASILEEADCGLLLDVNNVYVNSVNHKFDARDYMKRLPLERVVQIHVAGHSSRSETLIDTHGAPVIDPVWQLLDWVLQRCDVKAVMLERDQNFPPFSEILDELKQIRKLVAARTKVAS